MKNSEKTIKRIRNATIKGIIWSYLPLYLIGLTIPLLEQLPEAIEFLIFIFTLITFVYGLLVCGDAANKYADYKGYKNYFYLYSILNIFGLSILFLLKNKNISHTPDKNKHPLENFSISTIFISWIVIPLILLPPFALIAFYISGAPRFEEYFLENKDFSAVSNIPVMIIFAWYFFKEFKRAKINSKLIFGSWKRIHFKFAIEVAVFKYFFAYGLNYSTLYGLSFLIPEYVESQINERFATTIIGWICVLLGSLIFAPIMEELIYRGIIFQKITVTKNSTRALFISAVAFAIMHFRYDVVTLFISGILYIGLYIKTKNLIVPIISHCFYNLIVIVVNFYYQYFSNTDSSVKTTVVEYQQNFRDNLELYIVLLAISTPYLAYFIYKNFPRNFTIAKLPYFVNQERLSEITY